MQRDSDADCPRAPVTGRSILGPYEHAMFDAIPSLPLDCARVIESYRNALIPINLTLGEPAIAERQHTAHRVADPAGKLASHYEYTADTTVMRCFGEPCAVLAGQLITSLVVGSDVYYYTYLRDGGQRSGCYHFGVLVDNGVTHAPLVLLCVPVLGSTYYYVPEIILFANAALLVFHIAHWVLILDLTARSTRELIRHSWRLPTICQWPFNTMCIVNLDAWFPLPLEFV